MGQYTVGLTGGIASGKSAVADAFARLGICVADADAAARDVVARGSAGLAAVIAAFGTQVLDGEGHLDRAAMRRRVFEDPDARLRLERIVHPLVRQALQAAAEAATGPYAVVAIPLLAEGGGRAAYPWLDRILVVDVPVAVQAMRLMARDAIDQGLATRMIQSQADRHARLAIADDVLVNGGTLEALYARVAMLDRQYRKLAAISSLPATAP